jgi:hypothetical protein
MSLYLNFTCNHIIEEDFTKTIAYELKSCHRLKAIDLNYTFSRESAKKAILRETIEKTGSKMN